jgi:hypothetical protein
MGMYTSLHQDHLERHTQPFFYMVKLIVLIQSKERQSAIDAKRWILKESRYTQQDRSQMLPITTEVRH